MLTRHNRKPKPGPSLRPPPEDTAGHPPPRGAEHSGELGDRPPKQKDPAQRRSVRVGAVQPAGPKVDLQALHRAEEQERFRAKLKNSALFFGLSKADRRAEPEQAGLFFAAASFRARPEQRDTARFSSKETSSVQDSRLSVRLGAAQPSPQGHPFQRDASLRKIEGILDLLLTPRRPAFQGSAGKLAVGRSDRQLREQGAELSQDRTSRMSTESARNLEFGGAKAAPKPPAEVSRQRVSVRLSSKLASRRPGEPGSPRIVGRDPRAGLSFVIKARDQSPWQASNPRTFMRLADLAEELSEVPELQADSKQQAPVVEPSVQVSRVLEENRFTLGEVKRYFSSKAMSVMEGAVQPFTEAKLKQARSSRRIRLVDPDEAVKQQILEIKQREAVVPAPHLSNKLGPRLARHEPSGPAKPRLKFSDIYFTSNDVLLSKEALKALGSTSKDLEPPAEPASQGPSLNPLSSGKSAFELVSPQRAEFSASSFRFGAPGHRMENRESASAVLDLGRSDEQHVHLAVFGGMGAGVPRGLQLFDSSSLHSAEKNRWEKLELASHSPALPDHFALAQASAVCIAHRMLLFGGLLSAGSLGPETLSNKLVCIDIEAGDVQLLRPLGPKPPPRRLHAACLNDHNLLVSGGQADPDSPNLSDLWVYSARSCSSRRQQHVEQKRRAGPGPAGARLRGRSLRPPAGVGAEGLLRERPATGVCFRRCEQLRRSHQRALLSRAARDRRGRRAGRRQRRAAKSALPSCHVSRGKQ